MELFDVFQQQDGLIVFWIMLWKPFDRLFKRRSLGVVISAVSDLHELLHRFFY
jgi:hypothetical protein